MSLLLPLFLASALAGTPALGAAAPAKQPDPAVAAQADVQFQAYDKCQAGTIDLQDGAQASKFGSISGAQAGHSLIFHQACLASIPGSGETCAQMGRAKAACLEDVEYARLISAIVDNGDATAVCAKFRLTPSSGKAHPNHAKKCDFLVAALRRGSPDVCGEARAAGVIPEKALAQCRTAATYFNGDPDRCGPDQFCRERAALLNGLRSKDFRKCALSPWCRAITTRKPEACAPYVAQANKAFCEQVAKVVVPLKQAKAARDAKLEEQKAKQKKVFKKGEPMHVMDPSKTLKPGALPAPAPAEKPADKPAPKPGDKPVP